MAEIASVQRPCHLCGQELKLDGTCANLLCRLPRSDIYLEGTTAIAIYQEPLRRVITEFKYNGGTGWAIIFGRLLYGHLRATVKPTGDVFVMHNPDTPGRDHGCLVLKSAAAYSIHDMWEFDDPDDPAILKTGTTPRSAGQRQEIKREYAQQHAEALRLQHAHRIRDKRIVLYDDILTTGYQLNEVARRLTRDWGARSVRAIVLARPAWHTGPQ